MMQKQVLSILLLISTGAPLAHAGEMPSGNVPEACRFLEDIQDSNKALRLKNCASLFANKTVPNQKALNYTLNFMRDNLNGLQDSRCLPPNVKGGSQTVRIRKRNGTITKTVQRPGNSNLKAQLEGGVKNTCQFLINDVNAAAGPRRSKAYYIDLCATNSSGVVSNLYMNKGTGSGHVDKAGNHTTLLGAFLTAKSVRQFNPIKMSSAYRSIKNQFGTIPALDIYGINSSNNETSSSGVPKPIHFSNYQSSWGCPSIAPTKQNLKMMKQMAANGPSLMMSYGDQEFHSDTKRCDNVPAKQLAQWPASKRALASSYTPSRYRVASAEDGTR